jgi:hypothetical protein
MITLPDNYEELIAESLREMAAQNARTIANLFTGPGKHIEPSERQVRASLHTGPGGKITAEPITITTGNPNGNKSNKSG